MKKAAVRKGAILSLAMVSMSTNAISVLLGDIQTQFPEVDATSIQSVATIPAVTIVIFTLLAGALSGRVGARRLLLAGLAVYTVGGLAPFFFGGFGMLLASRLVLGAGIGLITPLSVGLIADFYQGDEQAAMMGLQFSVGNIGQMLIMFLTGALAAFGWRVSFGIYLTGAAVFLCVLLFLEEPPRGEPAKEKPHTGSRVNRRVLGAALLFGLYNLGYNTLFSGLALMVAERGLGGTLAIGSSMSLMTLVSMATAALFGLVFRRLKRFLGAAAAALAGMGFLLLALAPDMAAITAALVVLGVGNALLMPLSNMWVTADAPEGAVTFCLAVFQVSMNIGKFLSPYVFGLLGMLTGNTGGRFPFFVTAGCILLGAAGFLFRALRRGRAPLTK